MTWYCKTAFDLLINLIELVLNRQGSGHTARHMMFCRHLQLRWNASFRSKFWPYSTWNVMLCAAEVKNLEQRMLWGATTFPDWPCLSSWSIPLQFRWEHSSAAMQDVKAIIDERAWLSRTKLDLSNMCAMYSDSVFCSHLSKSNLVIILCDCVCMSF